MVFHDIVIKNKKILLIILIIVVGIFLISPIKAFINNQNAITNDKYTVLKKGECINTIQAKGKINTLDDPVGIYAKANNQSFKVSKINCKVGDVVNEGDILAVLDGSDLKKDIEESREKLNTTKSTLAAQLKIKEDLYKSLKEKYDNNLNESVNESESNLEAAKIDLDEKNRIYNQKEIMSSSNAAPEEEMVQAKVNLDNAQNKYDKAASELASAKKDVEDALNTAKNEYDAAKAANDDKSGDIALKIKEDQLNDCEIRADKGGTITKVNAKEATPCGTSALFELQDLNNLVAEVDVKESDISKISLNQKAYITSDSLGDEKLEGTVYRIDPIAESDDADPLELKDDSDDDEAEFLVKIKFDNCDERIKQGMNVDSDIVLEEKSDSYKVKCSSVVKQGDDDYIYVAEKSGDNYIVRSLLVTKGIENDTEVEIDGENIKDGLIVLNTPSDYDVGKIIHIKNEG